MSEAIPVDSTEADISKERVELVCDNLYGASCDNGELDASRNMLRALRSALTAFEKAHEEKHQSLLSMLARAMKAERERDDARAALTASEQRATESQEKLDRWYQLEARLYGHIKHLVPAAYEEALALCEKGANPYPALVQACREEHGGKHRESECPICVALEEIP